MFIEDFFNTQYVRFADYRTNQRLPNHDGLIETQRKVLYTFLNENKVAKERTITLMADVMKCTHYNHGDKSVINVINTMVAEYKNNIPLFQEDGQFGYRSNPRASDARYTYTRLKKYTKILFNPIDNEHFTIKQKDADGNEVEPQTLIPILPLLAINGNRQIGVGFASSTLPRNPDDIIKLIKGILTKQTKTIPQTITPWIWCFKGDITPNRDDFVSWTYTGIIKPGKKDTLIIEEIPYNYTREGYLGKLNTLKETGKIISYKENINENSFYIEVKVEKKVHDMDNKKLIKLFSLESNQSEFCNVLNQDGEIITDFKSLGQYLYTFIIWRISIYEKRKKFLLDEMLNNINKANEIVRFIKQVNENEINIHKQNKSKIEEQLVLNNYLKINDSFNYLTNLRIYDLTEEESQEYLDWAIKLKNEYDHLEKQTTADLWLQDIEEFEKAWKKEKHY